MKWQLAWWLECYFVQKAQSHSNSMLGTTLHYFTPRQIWDYLSCIEAPSRQLSCHYKWIWRQSWWVGSLGPTGLCFFLSYVCWVDYTVATRAVDGGNDSHRQHQILAFNLCGVDVRQRSVKRGRENLVQSENRYYIYWPDFSDILSTEELPIYTDNSIEASICWSRFVNWQFGIFFTHWYHLVIDVSVLLRRLS